MELENDRWTKLIGRRTCGRNEESLGRVINLIYSKNREKIPYLVIASDQFYGNRTRYFAIPAHAKFIKAACEDRLLIDACKDDLTCTMSVSANQCPQPNTAFGASFFELHGYQKLNKDSAIKTHHKNINHHA